MKQALEALERGRSQIIGALVQQDQDEAITALRQAIAEAEKQEPVAFRNIDTGEFCTGGFLRKDWAKWQPLYPAPVHTIDISQERVDETAKRKHEPVAWREVAGKTTQYYDYNEDGRGEPLYATPVHAIDMSQERVDETAKRKHEWVGLDGDIPGLGLVTEEFYNGMLCAEDILRRRNT